MKSSDAPSNISIVTRRSNEAGSLSFAAVVGPAGTGG